MDQIIEINDNRIIFDRGEFDAYVFEPDGVHSFTQKNPEKGSLIIKTGDRKIYIPEMLLGAHRWWLKQTPRMQECTLFIYDYVLLDAVEQKEIDTMLAMVGREIQRRNLIKIRRF